MRLLLVEDDGVLAQALQAALVKNHYVVNVATDGEEGWDYAQSFTYDLMLLDVSLPKLDGISLCQRLRDHHFRNPILLLTARDTSADKVAGLDAGADDYVVKPCTIPELLARIRALLRRRSTAGSPILYWGELSFDPSSCEVKWQGQSLTLSPKELNLLELLLRNPTQVFTKGAILEHLWSFDDPPGEETVRAHIKGLRRKLKQVGATDVVETVYGVGYRLKDISHTRRARSGSVSSGSVGSAAMPQTHSKVAQTQVVVAQMWQQFREPILARLGAIEAAIAALGNYQLTSELRADAQAQAHKLVGSLGMYGLMAGSDYARQLEQHFGRGVTPADQAALTDLLRSLRALLPQLDDPAAQPTTFAAGAQPSRLPTPSRIQPPAPPVAAPLTILVVDPDPVVTAELAAEAPQWHVEVVVAHSIAQAQASMARVLPQAIVLELAFPTTPRAGRQFLERLTQEHAQIPIFVLTGQDHFHDRVAVARLGGQGFFTKPLPAAQILQAVAQSCQQLKAPEAKILVVDDDPLLLQRLQDYLQAWGFLLETVSDPRQFWQVLQATQPDILILDVEMPHINGIELCQVVRNEPLWSSIPIIFLSANRDQDTLRRIYEVGADDFINKPVTEPELITRVVNRLERSQLLQVMTEQDPLTGVANRAASERAFGRFMDAAQQEQRPFSLALVTINHLRQINGQYGHAVGDRILQRFGQLLKQSFTREDIVARWFGSEFVLGLYGLDSQAARNVVLRVLMLLEQEVFLLENNGALHLTLRGAIVSYPAHSQTLQQLYQQADRTLMTMAIETQSVVEIGA